MLLRSFLVILSGALVAAAAASSASAQNVSSVFSPVIDSDDHEMEFRAGFNVDGDTSEAAYRLHYQRALNDAVRLRAIVGYADPAGGDLEPTYLQGELQWQFVEAGETGWASALRTDVRINEGDDRSHQLGVNWTNQWQLENGLRIRAIALFDTDFGDRARDGVFFETRTSFSRKLDNGLRIGFETFSDFGDTDSGFGGFDDQAHSIGPALEGGFNDQWSWYAGVQLGVSDGANDQDVQLRVTRGF